MKTTWIFSKKTVYILISALVIYSFTGFFLLPVVGKNIISNRLSRILKKEISIKKISVNPFSFSVQINDFNVKKTKVLFSADKIYVNFSFIGSLFTFSPVVSRISIDNFYLNIVRNKNGFFNFSDILSSGKKQEDVSGRENHAGFSPDKIIKFIIKNISVSNGNINFKDNVENVLHIVKNISVHIPFISNKGLYKDKKTRVLIDFILNNAKFKINAGFTPFAVKPQAIADINLSGVNAVHYLPYLPVPDNISVKSLGLNLNIHTEFYRKKTKDSLFVQGEVDLCNADIKEINGKNIVNFPLLSIDIARSDVFAHKLYVSDLSIKSPVLNLIRNENGSFNLPYGGYAKNNKHGGFAKDYQNDSGKQENNNKAKLSDNFYVSIENFDINNALIRFHDYSLQRQFNTEISPLNVTIHNLKAGIGEQGTDVSGDYKIKFSTESKEKFLSAGNFHIGNFQSYADGILKISNFMIKKYAPYYRDTIHADVADGSVSMSTVFKVSQTGNKTDGMHKSAAILTTDLFSIRSLKILSLQTKKNIIDIPLFRIKDATVDLGKKEINIKNIFAQNGRLLVKRLKNGRVNLAGFISHKPDMASAVQTGETSPWKFTVNSLDINGFNVLFKDLTVQEPVSINLADISFKGKNLKNYGTDSGNVELHMAYNGKGRINIMGDLIPSALSSDLNINFKNIGIKSLQPYFTDFIRIVVTNGYIQANGRLSINLKNKKKKYFNFKGQTSVNNFICLDKLSASDFFKCNSLYFSGINASVFPVKIQIKDISLTDFYSRITINRNGRINLNTILKKNNGKIKHISKNAVGKMENNTIYPLNEKQKKDFTVKNIQIKNITLQGGDINFSDYSTTPYFTADMKKIAGSLKGLSSDEGSKAELHLQGVHGQSSPLIITGEINPLTKKKFADIHLLFKDIEMSNLTPYSSKYIGYKIDKGKLDLDLKYLITGNRLSSDNRIRFDNLTLGEKVKSDKATSLPVSLAISLLKNRKGQIDLDLPVKGRLNDPKFKIGSIILKMISNLVIKVVTSPFSVIGSMFGGGEELAYVHFRYGSAKIDDANYKKIDTLAEILRSKPSVKLEIRGFYDAVNDYEALKMQKFYSLLKAEKLKKMFAAGLNVKTLSRTTLGQKDMKNLVNTLYTKAKFPKPMDNKGCQKQISYPEKKKLLITNINIDKNDLRMLAVKRSENVKAYLVLKGKIAKNRIFLLEPQSQKVSKSLNTSEVRFLLK